MSNFTNITAALVAAEAAQANVDKYPNEFYRAQAVENNAGYAYQLACKELRNYIGTHDLPFLISNALLTSIPESPRRWNCRTEVTLGTLAFQAGVLGQIRLARKLVIRAQRIQNKIHRINGGK